LKRRSAEFPSIDHAPANGDGLKSEFTFFGLQNPDPIVLVLWDLPWKKIFVKVIFALAVKMTL
jgi:hypothetical protein